MTKKQTIDPSINEYIIRMVKDEKPETVGQLVKIIKQEYQLSENQITNILTELENEGKIRFTEKETPISMTPKEYIFSSKAAWYWTITGLALATTTSVFAIPENSFPIVYARYLLGSLFVLFLPGYSFIKALFPTEVPIRTRTKELDTIERIALSLGMSLAIVPITGLLLNYTPWGIRITPITLSLLALTITLATAALIREYYFQRESNQKGS